MNFFRYSVLSVQNLFACFYALCIKVFSFLQKTGSHILGCLFSLLRLYSPKVNSVQSKVAK